MFGELDRVDGCLFNRNACVVMPGKCDRSTTGTGCSALMAVLQAKGLMQVGDRYIGEIVDRTTVGNHAANIATITGRALIT